MIPKDDFTVVTRSLAGAGAVEIPFWKLARVINRSGERLSKKGRQRSHALDFFSLEHAGGLAVCFCVKKALEKLLQAPKAHLHFHGTYLSSTPKL